MEESQEFNLTGTLSPKEPTPPEPQSFLDRIFGDNLGMASRAIAKMLLIFVFVFGFTIGADELSTWAFGENSPGNEFSIGLGFVASLVLSRLAWVVKY